MRGDVQHSCDLDSEAILAYRLIKDEFHRTAHRISPSATRVLTDPRSLEHLREQQSVGSVGCAWTSPDENVVGEPNPKARYLQLYQEQKQARAEFITSYIRYVWSGNESSIFRHSANVENYSGREGYDRFVFWLDYKLASARDSGKPG